MVHDEIPPEVWKTSKSDDILCRLCNTVYIKITIEKWTKGCTFHFSMKGDPRIINLMQIHLFSSNVCCIAWNRRQKEALTLTSAQIRQSTTCFEQDGTIPIQNDVAPIWVDFGSNISSTESNVKILIGKAWAAIDRLSIIWKSDLPDKIIWEFL